MGQLSEICHLDIWEFYDYNIIGLHAGDQNAVFLDLPIKPIKTNDGWDYELEWLEIYLKYFIC